MFDELPFLNKGEVPFRDKAILFCYTDGITEMENESGHAFGTENLTALLIKNQTLANMNILHETMIRHFDEFRGDTDFPDDVTFLSVRISG
jgi:sigma-B regulation protein RsbU (phosphoserine phosphatase)